MKMNIGGLLNDIYSFIKQVFITEDNVAGAVVYTF